MSGRENDDVVARGLAGMGFDPCVGVLVPTDADPLSPLSAIRLALRDCKSPIVYELAAVYLDLDRSTRRVPLRIGSTTSPRKRWSVYVDGIGGALRDAASYAPVWRVLAAHVAQADFIDFRAWTPTAPCDRVQLLAAERLAFSARAVSTGRTPAAVGLAASWGSEFDALAALLPDPPAIRGEGVA